MTRIGIILTLAVLVAIAPSAWAFNRSGLRRGGAPQMELLCLAIVPEGHILDAKKDVRRGADGASARSVEGCRNAVWSRVIGVFDHTHDGGRAMKYTILIYETEADFAARTDEGRRPAYWGAYQAYTKALTDAGVMAGGAGLEPPPVATTVRQRHGKRDVQDGPYAEAKEQLGGYYVIDVPGLDEALEWAARCPGASTGAVEVRPNLAM